MNEKQLEYIIKKLEERINKIELEEKVCVDRNRLFELKGQMTSIGYVLNLIKQAKIID